MNTILVFEDDSDIREMMTAVLQRAGYNVEAFPTTLPIADVIKINPGLILLDHYIPHTLGGDYCVEIKSHPQTEHIPILLVSAAPHLKGLSENAYADGYILKPFDIIDLEKRVEKAILK